MFRLSLEGCMKNKNINVLWRGRLRTEVGGIYLRSLTVYPFILFELFTKYIYCLFKQVYKRIKERHLSHSINTFEKRDLIYIKN